MKEFCKKHRLSTNSLSMNSEGGYVCTGPQNEEPGGEGLGRAGGGKHPARRASYLLIEFSLNINEINHWMASPMRKILLLMVTSSKQPNVPIILKKCSVLLSLLFILFNFFN